jgi:ElaB/YqjD/DUF883 family membrane-anchored ribosome-binding protein
MVDRNVTDTAQNAADAAQAASDATREYANKGYNAARDYANKGYDAAREYASTGMDVAGRVGDNLTEFVRNEPWIAVVAAFAVGYVAARMVRRLSI